MNLLFSFVIAMVGIILVFYNKRFALVGYRKIQIPAGRIYEKLFGWTSYKDEKSKLVCFVMVTNRIAIILVGSVLIAMAYSIYFGQSW
jgi:hypothetical protein